MLQLATITSPFFKSLSELGEFEEVAADELPAPYQTLLAHDDHMTVTVEAYHGSLVNVRVLQERRDGDVYTRASLLTRQSDGAVVQFGIMRINLVGLSDVVRREIEQRGMPLGRILIRHNVMRHVRLFKLWRIRPGPVVLEHLLTSVRGVAVGGVSDAEDAIHRATKSASETPPTKEKQCIYGRSAGIVVEGRPSVELLEIVKA
ncbi:MAG TPA: hypothetical protein VF175_13785 [Lacipirellula sp.]